MRPFLSKQRRRIDAQVGRRALRQTFPPLPPHQLTLNGAEYNHAHGAVVLASMAPETFVKVVRDVSNVQSGYGMSIA